ncbi:hypothetical protein ACW9KT_12085 [Hymenobacter sp. HD11105]
MKRLARQYLNFAPQLSVMARRHLLLRRASASELLCDPLGNASRFALHSHLKKPPGSAD